MFIRCHQCVDAVSPDLPWFDFQAVAMCNACARKNLERYEAGLEEDETFETTPDPHPTVADIEGKLRVMVDTSPEGLAELRERADAFLKERFEEFRRQLPLFKDAYLSMDRDARPRFRRFVEGLAGLTQLENEGFENPFAVFGAELHYIPLEPASDKSLFAGQYVGNEEKTVFWVRALAAALDAWDSGWEFQPASLEDMKPYEE